MGNVTFLFLAWTAETHSTIKVFYSFYISYRTRTRGSESRAGAGAEVGTAPPRLRTTDWQYVSQFPIIWDCTNIKQPTVQDLRECRDLAGPHVLPAGEPSGPRAQQTSA